ncbi:MAG TPA: hypothetical protein VFY36_00585 [Solirubrobacteraceae bacterium]|nr:hypothetical protein [Solirubrobacteraceae bacterium]
MSGVGLLFPDQPLLPFVLPDLFYFMVDNFAFDFSPFFGVFLFFEPLLCVAYVVFTAGCRLFANGDADPNVFFALRLRVAFVDAGF